MMGLFRHKKEPLARPIVMQSRPMRVPVPSEEGEDGGLVLLIAIPNAAWHVRLNGKRETIKRFVLDRYGRDVYERCDGRTPLLRIIQGFAKAHGLGTAEAEVSVTAFLKTLVGKRLVLLDGPPPNAQNKDRTDNS